MSRTIEIYEQYIIESLPEELPIIIGELARLQALAQSVLYSGYSGRKTPSNGDVEKLNVAQVARRLNCSTDTIYRLCHIKDGIPKKKIGNRFIFLQHEVDEWFSGNPDISSKALKDAYLSAS